LVVHGILKDKENKRKKEKSKSHAIPKSSRNLKEKCWNYIKVRNFKRECKEEKKKNMKENNDPNDKYRKFSHEDGGDSFVLVLVTHAKLSESLTKSGASFHVTSHYDWFSL